MAHRGGLLGIVVVLGRTERRLEVDGPRDPGRALVAVVVEDAQRRPRPRLPDGARPLQPPVRIDHGGAALGTAVVLEQDRPPPFDHPVLHVHRARRRGVEHRTDRGDVGGAANVVGQREKAMEHRGHHLRVRDLIATAQLEHRLGRPLVHEDDGVADVQRGRREPQRRRVVQGTLHEMDAVADGDVDLRRDDRRAAPRRPPVTDPRGRGRRLSGGRSYPTCTPSDFPRCGRRAVCPVGRR